MIQTNFALKKPLLFGTFLGENPVVEEVEEVEEERTFLEEVVEVLVCTDLNTFSLTISTTFSSTTSDSLDSSSSLFLTLLPPTPPTDDMSDILSEPSTLSVVSVMTISIISSLSVGLTLLSALSDLSPEGSAVVGGGEGSEMLSSVFESSWVVQAPGLYPLP